MARPVQFEGQDPAPYTHPDCYNLPVRVQPTMLGKTETVEVISAWQLSDEEMAQVKANGGVVFLRVIGGQPPVEVTGFSPIKY